MLDPPISAVDVRDKTEFVDRDGITTFIVDKSGTEKFPWRCELGRTYTGGGRWHAYEESNYDLISRKAPSMSSQIEVRDERLKPPAPTIVHFRDLPDGCVFQANSTEAVFVKLDTPFSDGIDAIQIVPSFTTKQCQSWACCWLRPDLKLVISLQNV